LKIETRQMLKTDWDDVALIYQQGIITNNATFQPIVPEWEEWDSNHIKECRMVALVLDEVVGWVALSPTSKRKVFSGVAEISIYVKENYRGKGIASLLIKELIEACEQKGYWTIEAKIFPENKESIALHKKFGFREVGIREKIGRMPDGNWRDIVLLEHRSKSII